MTEFMDPDHEAMGDAAGDLTDPTLDNPTIARSSADSGWDPRPPNAREQDTDTNPEGGDN